MEPIMNALLSLHGRQTERWAAAVASLRQVVTQEPGVSERPAPTSGRDVLQRVSFSDTPGCMFLLSRWGA